MLRAAVVAVALASIMLSQSCATPAPSPKPKPKPKQPSFIAEYVTPSNRSLRDLEAKAKSDRMLEKIADNFNEYLDLPEPVRISLAQCGVANAFYNPSDRRITLCYELLVDLARRFSALVNHKELLDGAVTFILDHELGHAVIHGLDLPVLGREEDAADELAALSALEDPNGAPVILGAVVWLASNAKLGRRVSLPEMADEHALTEQRLFNMLCWAYGSNPSEAGNFVTAGLLTVDRAAKCPADFAQIKKSWYRLLGAHLKKPFNTPDPDAPAGGKINLPEVPPVVSAPPPITEKPNSPPVKMSSSGICHAPGTSFYGRTKTFAPYPTLEACLAAGGRLPK